MSGAFTLIELLVTVAIIAVLAGLILAGAGPLRQQAMRQRTQATIQNVLQALATQAATSGGSIDPTEHPLAGSQAPRPAFVRASGGNVAATGEALRGVALGELADAGAADRLLLPDDRYAEPGVPLLYGLERRAIGILGAPRSEVTAYRRLTVARGVTTVASTAGFAVVPDADTQAHDREVRRLLGEGVLAELSAQNAAWAPPDDLTVNLAWQDRVWAGPITTTSRRPGSRMTDPGDGQDKPYRIRGLGIYDAWGRELLFAPAPGGGLRLGSAGRDGGFRFSAAPGSGFATPAQADAPVHPDRDAASDNIWSSVELR